MLPRTRMASSAKRTEKPSANLPPPTGSLYRAVFAKSGRLHA